MTDHDDEHCFLADHSIDEYMRVVAENIDKYGLHLAGVLGTPGFTYTVGLLPRFGFELLVFGLPFEYAAPILNQIGQHLRDGQPLEFDKADARFTNLPVQFRKCGPQAQEFNGIAKRYFDRDYVSMVQIVLCDRSGKFPGESGFDHDYMDPRQPLLFSSVH